MLSLARKEPTALIVCRIASVVTGASTTAVPAGTVPVTSEAGTGVSTVHFTASIAESASSVKITR